MWRSLFKRPGAVLGCSGPRHRTYTTAPPEEAPVVIIGGGIAGCTTLHALAQRGVPAVLVERNRITSGTTWHTAGLVWSLRPSDVEVLLLEASREVYSGLEGVVGEPAGWINNGGLFISHTEERTAEYKRLSTLGKAYGVTSEMLDQGEVARRWPLLNGPCAAALYSPADGTVDPAMACAALLKLAKAKGAQVVERSPVTSIEIGESPLGAKQVTGVITKEGRIKTGCVVNCSGLWGGETAQLSGLTGLPLVPMRHAYVVSQQILGARTLPNVRDHDHSYYFRIQGDAICMGGYEPNPILLERGVPADFEFGLYELDWSVFAPHVEGASRLCEAFSKAGIRSTVCGPESFTPDHKPLLGEDINIFGLYHNCGYNSAGMMFSPGCAQQMAEWVLSGRPRLPMFTFDVRRFHSHQLKSSRWLMEKSHEAYARNYDLVFPADEPLGGRMLQLSPLHDALQEEGAVWQTRAGWERPAFFLKDTPSPVPEYDWGGSYGHTKNTDLRYEDVLRGDQTFGLSHHHDLMRAEALHCRTAASVFDLSYYGKFYLVGRDAARAADLIFTANLNKGDNRVVYTCLLNEKGGVEGELTVCPLKEGQAAPHHPTFTGAAYYVVASGFSAQHTASHIHRVLHQYSLDARLLDVTTTVGILSVQGPLSQQILEKALECDLSKFPVSTWQTGTWGSLEGTLLRVGWVGEKGWEVHTSAATIGRVLERLQHVGGGWRHGGWRAHTSLSAEKGYHLWNADVRPDDTPIEAGLGFTCRKQGEYLGKRVVDEQRAHGVTKRYVFFTIDQQRALHGLEAVYRDGRPCTSLRRGDYGYHINKPIGVGYIPLERGQPLEELLEAEYHIESLGELLRATPHLHSPFDPTGNRIKGIY